MKEFTFNVFKEIFLAENIQIVSIKKTFLKKYLLIRIEFNYPNTDIIFVQKTSEQLKKVYSSVKKIFPNFQVKDKKHRQNLRKIIELTKQEMQKQEHTILLDSLYGFLFKSKNFDIFDLQKNFEEQNDNSDGSFDDGYLKQLSNNSHDNKSISMQIETKNIASKDSKRLTRNSLSSNIQGYSRISQRKSFIQEQNSFLLNDEFLKDFMIIFKQTRDMGSVSYQRMQYYEKQIKQIQINDTDFEVMLKLPNQHEYTSKYIVIKDKALYIYNSKREYFLDQYSYQELFVLIVVDKVTYKFDQDNLVSIYLHFEKDTKATCIKIDSQYYVQFLIKFLQQILIQKSPFYNPEVLPDPLIHRGNFLLIFQRIQTDEIQIAKQSDKKYNIKSNLFNIDLEVSEDFKSLILPIVNVFDIIEISHKNKKIILEIQKILEFETGKTKHIKRLGFFRVMCQPWNDRILTYCENVVINYHEEKKLDQSISSTIDELKICVYRIKRFQAIRWLISCQINDFFNFKYPRFSSVFLLLSALFLIYFSLLNFVFAIIFLFLIYFHPVLKAKFDNFIQRQLINQRLLNKDFIVADYITDKKKRRFFYSKIENIDNQEQIQSSVGLTQKISNVIETSAYIPQILHFTIDWIEKIKNILMWKQKRKTESVIFLLFISVVFLMLISVEHLIVFYILYLFHRGRKYYKRLKIWNFRVLQFMINYFIKNVFEYSKMDKENLDDFFENFQDDEECKKKFSKQFSKFVSQYLFVTFDNEYWIDKFSKKIIMKKLLHTEERFYFPFFEEKRFYTTLYLIFFFIFSTPSDLYYYEMKKFRSN